MSYSIVIGNCCSCRKLFGFNPNYVPSVRVKGEREPLCRECIEDANPKRKDLGLPEIEIHPEAYEPQLENV